MGKNACIPVLAAVFFLLGTGFCDPEIKAVDPYANTSVLTEAFVVRIPTVALIEAGVNPLAQAPDGVSVLAILRCLAADEGEVIAGAKVHGRHGTEAESNSTQTSYFRENNRENARINPYSSEVRFEVRNYMTERGQIRIEYHFSLSVFDEEGEDNRPPDSFTFSWSGAVPALSGRPVIAGAAQNDETTTFLVLTATVNDTANDSQG